MYTPWGKSVAIDLYFCAHDRVNNKEILQQFVVEIIQVIGMVAHGPTYIDRFGSAEEHLEGYSAMQFIETSSITVHLDEVNNRAFVDIFSCKDFDAEKASEFTKQYFQAQEMKFFPLER